MIKIMTSRLRGPGSYREVLNVAFPLILSTGSWSLMQFVDRMFLTWYSADAIAASLPGGIMNWTIAAFFIGVASYVNTFVAQYYGARQYARIGSAVWQGVYISLFGGLAILVIYPLAPALFRLFGHSPEVTVLETDYFRIILFGIPFLIIANAATGFYSGRGKTWFILWVNLAAIVINLVMDYAWIFGKWGFPEAGIRGAGFATVLSGAVIAVIMFLATLSPQNNRLFHTLSGWRPDWELFRRLLRFGSPQGLQFTLEIAAFTFFIMFVGRLGVLELAASNIAFNINTLAFLPMQGMSIAVSSLVGQYLGDNKVDLAERATWSAFHLTFIYFGMLAAGYFLVPGLFLWPFRWHADPAQFEPIRKMVVILLRFVAFYCLFDGFNMIFSAAVKGAGDTRFVAFTSILLSWSLLLIPSFLVTYLFHGGLYWLWALVTLYIAALGIVFLYRFLKGPWRKMRVIEESGTRGAS